MADARERGLGYMLGACSSETWSGRRLLPWPVGVGPQPLALVPAGSDREPCHVTVPPDRSHRSTNAGLTVSPDIARLRALWTRLSRAICASLRRVRHAWRQLGGASDASRADAAHQLKTPLSVLRARLALMGPFPGREDLVNDLIDMETVVKNMLVEAALSETDRDRLRVERFDLVSVAQETVTYLAPLARLRGVVLTLTAERRAVAIAGSAYLMREAMRNIVVNAIRFSPDGGEIRVRVHGTAGFSVYDQGPGLNRDARPDHCDGVGGCGDLRGLDIVSRVVALHGGHFCIGNAPHAGAQVDVILTST